MSEVSENLGYDFEGMKNFHFLRHHITELLGDPIKTDLEKWGEFDLGIITWSRGKVRLSIVGIEHFNARYSLYIGLIDNPNEMYFRKRIEKMKQDGWTEEDFGK